MPRFYFDVQYDSEPWSPDSDCADLASKEEARAEAVALMAGLVKDCLRRYWQIAVRVRDDQPTPVLTLTLSMDADERPSG
jgi:hypothetical protein